MYVIYICKCMHICKLFIIIVPKTFFRVHELYLFDVARGLPEDRTTEMLNAAKRQQGHPRILPSGHPFRNPRQSLFIDHWLSFVSIRWLVLGLRSPGLFAFPFD